MEKFLNVQKKKHNVSEVKSKPICQYGNKCYRKNPQHFRDFCHPDKVREEEIGSKKSPPKVTKDDDDDPVPTKRAKQLPDVDEPSSSEETNEVKPSVQTSTMKTLEDRKKFIKDSFLFEMPDDFYILWDIASDIEPNNPCDAFKNVGLTLVGPFLVLAKKFDLSRTVRPSEFLLAWRYFYDVPEFQTVIVGDDTTLFHIGYLRDDPNEMPGAVCSNEAAKICKFTILGDNLIGSLHHYFSTCAKNCDEKQEKVYENLTTILSDKARDKKLSLGPTSAKLKERKRKVVASTFHGAGIVVPVENDVGYRSIGETDANLKKWLKLIDESDEELIRQKNLDKIQEIINYVQFANDECDYGMGLELGVDLFCSGCAAVHGQVYQLLSVAYQLLKRNKFVDILKVHLKHRQRKIPPKL